MDAAQLIAFEDEVAKAFESGKIRGPIHLSGGNEKELIDIFKEIDRDDWVFSTWRNHYHALLHGVDRDELMNHILSGRSMNFYSTRFFTSSIVAGCLPIAVGVAAAIKRNKEKRSVWCFVGDMVASMGAFQDAIRMARGLPITFVVEDNGLSVNSPTWECWPEGKQRRIISYEYERTKPHSGLDKWIQF